MRRRHIREVQKEGNVKSRDRIWDMVLQVAYPGVLISFWHWLYLAVFLINYSSWSQKWIPQEQKLLIPTSYDNAIDQGTHTKHYNHKTKKGKRGNVLLFSSLEVLSLPIKPDVTFQQHCPQASLGVGASLSPLLLLLLCVFCCPSWVWSLNTDDGSKVASVWM